LVVSYVTAQEFIDVYREQECIQLTQLDDPMADVIDYAMLDRALEDASEVANSYLRNRYELPVKVTRLLQRIIMKLARRELHRYDPAEVVINDAKEALKTLEQIRDGKISLGIEATTETQVDSIGSPEVFGLDSAEAGGFDLRGYS
jgi:phage gp36-like protein